MPHAFDAEHTLRERLRHFIIFRFEFADASFRYAMLLCATPALALRQPAPLLRHANSHVLELVIL